MVAIPFEKCPLPKKGLIMKYCTKCYQYKALENFQNKSNSKDGKNWRCKSCISAANFYYLLKRYNLSIDDLIFLKELQEGRCAVCKIHLGESFGNIDHDHSCCPAGSSCGECVRGLLCTNCNSGLGMFQDNEELLQSAITYLQDGGFKFYKRRNLEISITEISDAQFTPDI